MEQKTHATRESVSESVKAIFYLFPLSLHLFLALLLPPFPSSLMSLIVCQLASCDQHQAHLLTHLLMHSAAGRHRLSDSWLLVPTLSADSPLRKSFCVGLHLLIQLLLLAVSS